MKHKLSDLVDAGRLQELMDDFYRVIDVPMAILEADGTVLTATTRQPIRTEFHRVCPELAARCAEREAYTADNLDLEKPYTVYECGNGLADVAAPMIIEGEHIGTVFAGQFLFEEPDVERFRQQAQELDLDEATYLEAVAEIPIVSQDRLELLLTYLSNFAEMLADTGLERMASFSAAKEVADSDVDMDNFQLTDLIEVETLQALQDSFAELHNVGSVIFDLEGNPITSYSNFSEFCQIIRDTEAGLQSCVQSDKRLGRKVGRGEMGVTPCQNLAAIMDGAFPIIVQGRHVATWGIGQAVTGEVDEEEVRELAREINVDEDKLVEASRKLERMSEEHFQEIMDFLSGITHQMSLTALQNLQQTHLLSKSQQMEKQLSTAADLAERVNTILDPDQLLPEVVAELQERFDLYHVHIYLLERPPAHLLKQANAKEVTRIMRQRNLVISAGSGKVGQKLLEQGHAIPLHREKSLVARAARSQVPVLVNDTSTAPDFMPNPLLPDTKSEISVPLVAGEEVFGVLDVQDSQPNRFSQSDVDVLNTLAGQIATSLRNAQIFEAQVEAEAEARRNAAQREALLNAIPDMMFHFDSDGIFLDYKAEAGSELMAPPEAFLGRHISDVLPPPLAKVTLEHLDKALQTDEQVMYEYQAPMGDEMRDYEARLTPSGNGEVLALIRDITERKQAEVALRESQERLSQVIDNMAVMLDVLDENGNIIVWNKECERVTGYTAEEIVDNPKATELLYPDPEYRAAMFERWAKRADEDFYNWEWDIVCKDGTVKTISWSKVSNRVPIPGWPSWYTGVDVTERKRAEEAQKRFATRLNTAAQISEQVGSILDPDELLETVIPLIKEQFGLYYVHVYTLDEENGTLNLRAGYGEAGEKMLAEGHSIPLDREASLVATAARTKEPVLVDDVTEDPNFMPNPLLPETKTEVAVPAIAGGEVLGVFDVQHDETHYFTDADVDVFQTLAAQIANAFHSAELLGEAEEVRDQAQRYLELVGSIIVAIDAEGKITLINRAGCELLGYEEEELIGRDWFATALPEAAQEEVRGVFAQIMAGDIAPVEEYDSSVVTKEGEERILSWHNSLLRDDQGNIVGTLSSAEDITERLRAEQAMRESQVKFQTVADYTYDWEYWLGPEDEFLYVSPACEKITGYTVEEFMDDPQLIDKIVHPDDRELLHHHMHVYHENPAEMATAEDAAETEFRIFTKEGEVRWIGHACQPVYGPEGEWLGRRASNRNITEQKQAEMERERFTQRLNTAAAISEQVGSILDPDELLETVIPLIKEQFGLYYVHVYTLDEESGTLNLRAGYGEAGEKMLAEGHSISLDREASLVATAARTKDPVLVDDVTENPNFMPNPLLPDTQTEVAVPAIAGGQVLGVFDVQHDETHYFTDADLDVFQTLAGQIANAFHSAELLEEAENVRDQAQRYLELVGSIIVAIDAEGKITLINRAGCELLGYEEEELIGRDWFATALPEAAQEEVRGVFAQIMAGDIAPVEEYDSSVVTKDGEERILSWHNSLLRDDQGNIVGTLSSAEDITERLRAEQAMRESQIKFQTVADYTYDWEYWLGPEDEFLYVSPACEKITGYTVDEFMDDPQLIDKIVHPGDREILHHHMHTYHENPAEVATADESAEVEFRIITKDGQTRWIGHACQAVYGPEGEWLGRRASNRDATDSKQAEMERQRFTTRLDTAAQISEQVGSILDPDELLETVIPLIKEQFGLYYVHVYTLDEESGTLNLRAGYGEAGEKMLAEGHSIPLDREASLVATAARTKESVLVDDVTENPNFMPNPLLPDTKTEVAIPSIAGGKVLGVFDVQHDEAQYFTQADVDVFQTLAAQIANAFRSAELLDELSLTQFSVDRGPAAIYWMRPDASLYDVNDTACQMLGYDREELLAIENFTDLDPNFPPEAWALHWEEIKEKKHMIIQTEHQTKDGQIIPVEVEVNYLKYGDQEFDCAFARDITERLEAERAVRESEERMRLLIEGVQDYAIVQLDPEGRVVGWNEGAQRIKGYTEEEIVGEHFSRFYPEEDQEAGRPEEVLSLARERGSYEDTGLRVRKDGSTFWADVVITAIRDVDGNLRGFSKVTRDITERVEAEAALRKAEAQQRAILETTPVGIAITSLPEGNVLYVNPEFTDILGYPEDEVMGQVVPNFYASQEEAEVTFDLLQSQNGALSDHEIRAVRADGSELWLSLSIQPLEYGGQPASLAAFVDITERRETQVEVERFAGRLNTAAAISEQVGSILDPDELLEAVIPLIKEQFGLYYVHVYTLDEESGALNLRAGYGEAGEKMLAEGHSIPLDREASLVATAARTKEPVLVDDVTENPNFMANPLLPDTKTEVAIPSIAGGKVLGVFDVQHDETHYFTDADVDVFQTLAAQIANAFRTAELYETAEDERAFYDGIIENLPVGVWAVDNEFKPLLVNPAGREMMGREVKDQDGGAYVENYDVINIETDELYDNTELPLVKAVTQGGEHTVSDAGVRHPDGTVVPMLINAAPLYDAEGEQRGAVVIFVDATEQHEAEEAIREERNFSNTVLSGLPGIFYLYDSEGKLVRWNENFQQVSGYSAEEMQAMPATAFIGEEDRELIANSMQQVFEEGQVEVEAVLLTKDGEKIPYYFTGIRAVVGGEPYLAGVGIDITERKQAEEAQKRFAARLDTAAQISEQVGSILDPDELLETVIPLIKERFGIYYVHVYTLDEKSGKLNLRAGYGEAGEKMLAEGHSIPLDREVSLVATAARTKEPVLVDDVTENPNFMPNPLLPDTKTEVAIPSIAGGKVLGVFDVQHDETHYFTDADVDVFQTLAAQIANAFRTAELYETAEDERAFYDGIIENLPVGVWAVDNEFKPLLVNPAGREMMGREVKDQDGGAYVENYEVIDVETGELYDNTKLPLVKAVTQGGEHSATGIGVRHPDGTVVPQIINAAPLYDAEGEQRGGVVIFVDATEQYEAQQAIRETQIKFQTVADYTYDWEYWLGPEDEFLYVSPACEKITGYTVEEFMETPNLLDEIVHPDDLDILHHHMHAYHENPAEVATAEDAAETEFRIFTKDGETRWIAHACQPVYGPDGEWLGRRASNRDATEAVKARESLAQNEERLSLALESGRVGIWEFWPQRDEVYFNLTYYTMLGYEPYELPQDLSTWSGLMHPDDVERANAAVMDSIQKGEDFHLQFQMQTKEGDWRWIQAHGYVTEHTPEGMAARVIGTHTDITERKQAQEEQSRLSAVLEATTDFVGIATPDGKGVYFNQAGREMVGIPTEAAPNKYEIVSFTPERELARTQEEILPTAIQEGAWTGESFICPLEGEEIPVLMTVISITDDVGNLRYLANIARDITEIREAQQAQERFAAQLSTAAEIAARVNAVLDPDELFNLVIPLTKERFDLYHVHFYAYDPESEMLNLRAGYGRAGELMLRQGHKIPYDRERSIVARAARDRELVVVNDVTAVPDHLPNMLLPDTKSEVAVPAIVGDQLLGVLDVQADEVDFFSESDLDVYRTLVGQIATAYQNARYFERQRESEAALRESAEKIRAIFNAITDGISVTNMTGEITDLNEALLDLHGYEQRDELLGRNTMELVARDDWPTATQNINHTLDEGSSRNQEILLVRKGGGVFDGEVSTALLQDDEGNPTGIISVVRNISERKRREAALRLTRASVDNAEDEIFWFDTEGNFFDVNRAACEILGYTREELLEMQVFDVDPDFPEEAWPGLVAQLREEGAVTLTSRHITKEGDIFPVEVTVNYLKFGGDEYFFSFAHDITERQRVEEERRRFTTQLRTAAEVAAQINAILDPQALLAEVVPLVQERFDLYHVHVYTLDEETDELVMRVGTGKAGRVMLEEGHKIALDRQKSLVARSARSKQPVLVNDVTQDPDFMPNPLLPDTKSEVAVPAIAGDRVLGVFDVQDDERNRFTESDLDVFTTLASQIAIAFQNAQYFEEVQRTAERLREVDRLKGEFLANMSHELRTPLNSILGYTEVILMGIDGPLNDEMKEDVDAIHKNGKHLLRLINDILDLTKIEAGRLKLEKEEVYVAPLFDDVRTNNIGYFHKQKSDIDFRVKVLDEDMRIHADRVRLTQILNNLVSNAAKFTDEGFVEMRAYREGDWACMEVEDTGIGISEDDLETVFERFRQVDGSNARRAEGTGLGLAITKHLVEMHGGHLEVHSEPGKGSIFSAYLPIYEPEAETAEEDPTG